MKNFVKKKLENQLHSPILPFSEVEKQLIEGKTKQELTEWWLHLIESSVENFVNTLPGITQHCIPYNYLDQAPSSLEAIQQNLEILRKLIHPQKYGDFYQVRVQLLEPLSSQIYSKLNHFLRQAQLLCLNIILEVKSIEKENFHLQNQEFNTNQKFEEKNGFVMNSFWIMQEYSQLRNSSLSNPILKKLKNLESLIRDIEYIEKMKQLELQFHHYYEYQNGNTQIQDINTEKGSSVSDIVPITGLIIGVLHRMENEHKTVFEHWSSRLSLNPKN